MAAVFRVDILLKGMKKVLLGLWMSTGQGSVDFQPTAPRYSCEPPAGLLRLCQ